MAHIALTVLAAALVLLSLDAPPAAASHVGAVPFIDVLMNHDKDLDLSPSQIESLERLDREVAREMVRRRADLALAYLDLGPGTFAVDDPTRAVDMSKMESLLRDIERKQADLRLVLVRATETVKAQLTPEQRAKLAALIDPAPSPASDSTDPPVVLPTAVHAPSPPSGGGRTSPHPSPHSPPPPSHHHHPSPGGHPWPHTYVEPFGWWWGGGPYWAYPPAPPIAQAPPVYVEPSPTYWYYCSSVGAYYPYVTSCPESWVLVPANP